LTATALFIAFSLGFCTYLPENFCLLFKKAFTKIGVTSQQANACKWRVFGVRFLILILYFPIEVMCFCVVRRNINDNKFNLRLKEALYKGEVELKVLVED
jgi:hypothetical protein